MLKYISVMSLMVGFSSGVIASTEMEMVERNLDLERAMPEQAPHPYDLTVKPKPAPAEETLMYPSETPESNTARDTEPHEPSWYRDKDTVGGIHDRGKDRTWR